MTVAGRWVPVRAGPTPREVERLFVLGVETPAGLRVLGYVEDGRAHVPAWRRREDAVNYWRAVREDSHPGLTVSRLGRPLSGGEVVIELDAEV